MLQLLMFQTQHLVGGFTSFVSSALNGNPLVAGAATASIVGSLFYVLRKSPMRGWWYLKRFMFFTYTIEYDLAGNRGMIQNVAEQFEHQLQKRVSNRRATARLITRRKRITESLADGGFFFRYAAAWIWVARKQETHAKAGEKSSAANTVVTLSMTALRFHRQKILDVLGESAKEYTVPGIYQTVTGNWAGSSVRAYRVRNFTTLPPLAIDHVVREKIDRAIDNFLRHRAEKNRLDLPHKLVFMLYGEPGTGKSALGEYIAWRLKTSLFCINGTTTDGYRAISLSDTLAAARDNVTEDEVPVILADDFDTYLQGLRKREPQKPGDESPVLDENVTLGRMLATLQSPTEITDCVVIFTTNHLELIDPALYRPGRVNVLLEIGRMSPRSIMEYFETRYRKPWPEHTPIERALRACDISAFYGTNEDDPDGFVRAVTSNALATDELFQRKTEVAAV